MINKVVLDTTQLFDEASAFTQKWLPLSISGLEFPTVVYSDRQKGGSEGRILNIGGFGGYDFQMDWVIWGDSFSDFTTQRQEFLKTWAEIISSGAKYLKYNKANGQNVQVLVKAVEVSGEVNANQPHSSRILLTLKTEYPFIVGQALNSEDVLLFNGGGFAIPFAIPFDLSANGSNEVVIENQGNVKAYPIIEIHGQITDPSITNATTGEVFSIGTTVATGTYVEIDTFNRVVTLQSAGTNYRQYFSGDFLTLVSGNNTFRLTGTGTNGSEKAVIKFRHHFVNL